MYNAEEIGHKATYFQDSPCTLYTDAYLCWEYRESTYKADSGNIPSPNMSLSLHILGVSFIDHCRVIVSVARMGEESAVVCRTH